MTQPAPDTVPADLPSTSKFFYSDGSEVPPEELESALKAGVAGPARGTRVPMLDSSGTPKWVDAEQFWSAQERGWQYESPDQEKRRKYRENAGIVEHGKAALEGGFSGATLGGSDLFLEAISDDETDEARRLRSEELSGTRGAFEFLGAVAPAFVTGGGSVAAQAGVRGSALALRGAGTAAKAALRYSPAGLATRGAMALERGAARMLPEATTALGRIGRRAATTAVGGAVEGGAFEAGRALSEAALAGPGGDYEGLGERMLASATDGAVFGAMSGGLLGAGAGAGKEVLDRTLRSDTFGHWAKSLRDESTLKALGARGTDVRKLRTETKIAQIADDLRSYRLANGDKVMGGVESTESLYTKVLQGHEEVMGKLDGFRKEMAAVGVDANQPARKWLGEVAEIVDNLESSPSPTIRAQGKKVRDETAYLRDLVEAGDNISYTDLRDVQRGMKKVIYPDQVPGKGLPTQPPEWAGDLLKAERRLESTLEGFADATFPTRAGEYRVLRRQAESFEKARAIGEKAVMQELGNRTLSLTDNLWGNAGMVGGWMTGGVGAAAAVGASTMAANHYARKYGRSIVADIAEKAMKFDQKFSGRLKNYFETSGRAAKKASTYAATRLASKEDKDEARAYDRVAKTIEEASRSRLKPVLMDAEAPKTAMATRGKAQAAAQYLVSNMPAPPAPDANPNVLRAQCYIPPTSDEIARFARRVAAVNNPEEVLDALEANALTEEHVDAIKNVYPKLYEDIRTAALESLSGAKELLPHWKRVQLGLLLDLPLDPSLNPTHIRISQSIYQDADPGGAGGIAPNQTAPGLNLSQKLATKVERIEGGETL